jgi:antitoxin (DNA-binding transcriptional repressor) of toxin-antitoxin stability system
LKLFFDSSVLVPVFYADHPQHASSTKLFLAAGKDDFCALRTLGEVYSTPSLLDRVSAGAEVIIERNSRPVAVVRPAEAPRGRLLSESIALAEAHAKELGYEPTMDADFAADLREIINSRKPRDLSAWD